MFAAPTAPRTAYSLLPNSSETSPHRRAKSTPRRRILLFISLFAVAGFLYLAVSGNGDERVNKLRTSAQQAWSCAVQPSAAGGTGSAGLLGASTGATPNSVPNTAVLSYPSSPLADQTVVMIKTGHSVAHSRMPPHLESPRHDMPHRFVYSDHEMTYAGVDFVDVIANITRKNYDQNDMKVYTDLHEAISNGVLPEDLAAFNMWQLDKYKFVPMHGHAYRAVPDAKWYIAMDGDTFIFYQNILRWLEQFDPNEPYYFGNKHTVNDRVWAQGGSGYVLSKGVMDKSIALDPWGWERKWDKVLNTERGGDVAIGRILKESLNISEPHPRSKDLFYGDPISSLRYSSDNWLAPLFSLHHLKASEVLTLRRFEQSILPTLEAGDYIRHCDLYRHFAPHALNEELTAIFSGSAWGRPSYRRKSWKAAEPNAVVFTIDWAKQRDVEYNADFCDLLCGERDECMSWTFENNVVPSERRCVHARLAFGFGQPDLATFKNAAGQDEPLMESGWRLDRVREIEKNQGCGDRARRRMSDAKNGW